MRQLVHSTAAAFIGFLAIATMLKGDLWGAWSYGALAAFVWLIPTLLVRHEPKKAEPSPLDPWLAIPPYAPTANAPADTAQSAGAIGAAPAPQER